MITDLDKNKYPIYGERGLPTNYPIPKVSDNLLFYIQRNLNFNTVVYEINKNTSGQINQDYPMDVYWIKYSEHGQVQQLNFIQNNLAFGYKSKLINSETYSFKMVSADMFQFYITNIDGQHSVITKINDQDAILSNIYVFADEVGLFPDVRYIEFYGNYLNNQFPAYQKVIL